MAQIATFYDHVKDIAAQQNISMAEALAEVKKLGVEQLEISQNNLLGREEELARELSAAGLGISTIPSYFNFGRDTDVEAQSVPTLRSAKFLGAPKLLVIPGFFKETDTPEDREAQVERMVDCVARLAELADGYGVSLVMEEYDNLLSPIAASGGVLRFLRGCPGLNACFDTGNFRVMNEELSDAYGLLKGRIGHVHLKDRAFTGPEGSWFIEALDGQKLYPIPVGEGDLDLAGAIEWLRRDGYDGTYTVEHYGAPDQLAYLKSSVPWVKARLA